MILIKHMSVLVFGMVLALLLSSCGNSSDSSEKNAVTGQSNAGFSETELFRFQVTEKLVEEWGFKNSEKDEFSIKSYSDPERNDSSDEVVSVIPKECLAVASLLLDSKESGSSYVSSLSFGTKTNASNALSVRIMAYDSKQLASSAFSAFLSRKDDCGSWIPKYRSGDTGLEMDLWNKLSTPNSKSAAWENSEYSEAAALTLVGSAIFDVYVSIENDVDQAMAVREAAVAYFGEMLRTKQQ